MDCTCILDKFTETELAGKDEKSKTDWIAITTLLVTIPQSNDCTISFPQFLTNLNLSKQEYVKTIRSSLSRTTVFLKRETNELYINAYNAKCLEIWQSNMDIQFCPDHYAVAMYIVSYMCRGTKGL